MKHRGFRSGPRWPGLNVVRTRYGGDTSGPRSVKSTPPAPSAPSLPMVSGAKVAALPALLDTMLTASLRSAPLALARLVLARIAWTGHAGTRRSARWLPYSRVCRWVSASALVAGSAGPTPTDTRTPALAGIRVLALGRYLAGNPAHTGAAALPGSLSATDWLTADRGYVASLPRRCFERQRDKTRSGLI